MLIPAQLVRIRFFQRVCCTALGCLLSLQFVPVLAAGAVSMAFLGDPRSTGMIGALHPTVPPRVAQAGEEPRDESPAQPLRPEGTGEGMDAEEGGPGDEIETAGDLGEMGQEDFVPPDAARGLSEAIPRPADASVSFLEELSRFERALQAYESEVVEYRDDISRLVELEYQDRRSSLREVFDLEIEALRDEERHTRLDAIERLEEFIRRYPDHPPETPDALFRLAELYFEQESDQRIRADEEYQQQLDRYDMGIIPDRPEEPRPDYGRTIETFTRLVTDFPDYRQIDGAYYLLGYSLLEMQRESEAADAFRVLVRDYPSSDFAQESWLRIGEYLFEINEYEEAALAYRRSMEYGQSALYDKALFKLGWSYYLANRYSDALAQFTDLIHYYEQMSGEVPGALREEALQYMAVVLSEEDWDLDGVKDPQAGMPRIEQYLGTGAEWEMDVCDRLAEVWFESERYDIAIAMYRRILYLWPEARENPQRHERIVASLSRMRQFNAAFDEQLAMSTTYRPGSRWYQAQEEESNFRAMAYAEDLARNTLLDAARYYNQQADELRDQAINDPSLEVQAIERYSTAAEGYADFLEQYPSDRQTYEVRFLHAQALYYSFRFLQAAEQYELVRDTQGRTERRELAAYQVVKSYEEAIYEEIQRGRLEARALPIASGPVLEPGGEARIEAHQALAPAPIGDLTHRLVDSYDRYVELGLNSEEDPTTQGRFAFLAAKVFFDYQHFDEARPRLEAIIDNPVYVCQDEAIFAAALLIESYRIQGDYENQERWSQRVASLDYGQCEGRIDSQLLTEFQAETEVYRLGAIFSSAEELFQAEQYEQAALEYVRLVNQNPSSEFAPAALNNAAVGYEYLQRYEAAMGLYQRIVDEYPQCEFVNDALWRLAENSKKFFDFDRAINTYLILAEREEDQERIQSALFQAARLQEMSNRLISAGVTYETYASRFPDAENAPVALFQAGLMHQQEGHYEDMARVWERLRRVYGNYPSSDEVPIDAMVLDSLRREADYYAEELADDRRARDLYRRVMTEYRRRRSSDVDSLYAAGKARFYLAQVDFEEWDEVVFEGTVDQQRRIFQEQFARIPSLVDTYNEATQIGSAEWTMAAYFMIGRVYQAIADKLYAAPIPDEIVQDEFLAEAYQLELEDFASRFEDEAVENWRVAIEVGRELGIVNEWTIATIRELNRYLGSQFPLYKEEPVYIQQQVMSPLPMMALDRTFLTQPSSSDSTPRRFPADGDTGIEELRPTDGVEELDDRGHDESRRETDFIEEL